ncbi:MAG: AMP-binding protein [Myxococcales bacterium]|nr:AMP-binding protein [Myxococcales bacterium]
MLELGRIESLGEALRDAVLTYKSNAALFEVDRHREQLTLSYHELRAEAERVAAALQAEGFEPGDRVAILMSNQARWVVSSMAGLWAGAVLIPLDYKLTAKEQLALLAHAKPRVLITEDHIHRELSEIGEPGLEHVRVLVTGARGDGPLAGAERFDDIKGGRFVLKRRQREDLASIVYSSGTGGTPKGCMLTHDNYLEQAQVLGRMFPMEEGDRYFSILPTNHAIDFMCGTVVPFLFGASVVHQRTLRAEFIAPTMKRYKVTHTAVVPRILRSLKEGIDERLDELPSWQRSTIDALMDINELATMQRPRPGLSRKLLKPIHDGFGGRLKTVFAGGAFVEPELAEYFYKLGIPIVIGYGLTEACTVLTVNDLQPFRGTTVGKPVAGVELELRDIGDDGVGEVYARGRTIMRGYLDAEELTAETLVDGWLRTGDLGQVDAAGHLRLRGRARNMIVTEGGKNIYPEDIEGAFEGVDCEELGVFASDFIWPRSGLSGERLTLVIRPRKKQAAGPMLAEVAAANRQLADFKRVSSYVVWEEEFPRTASMKLKRAELAAQVRERVNAATPFEEAPTLKRAVGEG